MTFRRFEDCRFAPKPWLMLGKGPSFSRLRSTDTSGYHVLTINHVVDQVAACDIAHFIDLEAFLACATTALDRARYVCMPYYPNVAFAPSDRSIAQLAADLPALRKLMQEGRLLTYNLSITRVRGRLDGYPDVELHNFSAEAVIDYLAKSGVTRILSLGVDGGTSYAAAFHALTDVTLLASGQSTYDEQFAGICFALLRNPVCYVPLDIRFPIVTTIRFARQHWLAAQVLAYSIRRHCPMSIAIRVVPRLRTDRDPNHARHPGVRASRGKTCELSLDARSLVTGHLMPFMRRMFSDSRASRPFVVCAPGRGAARADRPQVRAPWITRILGDRIAMFERPADLPWLSPAAPLHGAWMTALREAIYWKQLSVRAVRMEIVRGHVSPTIFAAMT